MMITMKSLKNSVKSIDQLERVNIFFTGRRNTAETEWPTYELSWKNLQCNDEWCMKMKEKFTSTDMKIPINQSQDVNANGDYYFIENEILKQKSYQLIQK